MEISKKEQLIKSALALFSKYGFHAVGINTILKESSIAKKTLYSYFKSKDELIFEVLRYHDRLFRNHFMINVENSSALPKERLLSIFDVAAEWFNDNNFYGCLFVSASSEFPEMNSQIKKICQGFKNSMQEYIEKLSNEAGVTKPKDCAAHLMLLLEGAITIAQINGSADSAKQAKKAAELLIKSFN